MSSSTADKGGKEENILMLHGVYGRNDLEMEPAFIYPLCQFWHLRSIG